MSEDYRVRFEVVRHGVPTVEFHRSEDAWKLFNSLVLSETEERYVEIIQTTTVRIASFRK